MLLPPERTVLLPDKSPQGSNGGIGEGCSIFWFALILKAWVGFSDESLLF